MGDASLAQATQEIGEDWNTFRERLIADIGMLGTFADTAAKTYDGVDADLASNIKDMMPAQPSPHLRTRAE